MILNSEKSHLVSLLSVIYKDAMRVAISTQRVLLGQEEHPLTKPGRKDKSCVNMVPSCLNAEYLQQSCTFMKGTGCLTGAGATAEVQGSPLFS